MSKVAYYAVIAALVLSVPALIVGEKWAERACADPNAWAQKSYGRAVAECEAKGGAIIERAWRKELVCSWKKEEVISP